MNKLEVNKFCKHNNKSNLIIDLQKKANISNSKCSILSPENKQLECLDSNDTKVLYSYLDCNKNFKQNVNYDAIGSGDNCLSEQFAKYNCKDTLCLLKKKYQETQSPDLLNIIKKNYKPIQPKNWKQCGSKNKHQCHYTWLSNIDIQNVMYHYQKKFKNFEFIGIFMIDFDRVQKDLIGRQINLFDLDFEEFNRRGINHLGIIFNTDTSKGSGIHWIAMQIFWEPNTMKKGEINFFDSAGSAHTIPFSILKLMKHLQSKYKKKGYDFITQVNKTNHQRENSECGVYSVYFLIYTLFNSYSDMNNNVIDDSTIHMFRDILWV